MKLSEAIRLGSTLGPQIREAYIGPDSSSCALGAAILAIGKTVKEASDAGTWGKFMSEWSFLEQMVGCPVCHEASTNSGVIGHHLNDMHGWTREAIADWVATIEPPTQTTPQLEAVEHLDQRASLTAV